MRALGATATAESWSITSCITSPLISLCIASATGFHPHPVARIEPPDAGAGVYPHFIDQYTKLRLWELDAHGARAVVYLDADTLALRNFDELFTLPYTFAAAPDVYTNRKGFWLHFNAGVLFLRPSSARFREFLQLLDAAPYDRHEAEQAFLNTFYAKDALRLPYAYNANLAIKVRTPRLWDALQPEMRIMHYTMAKPFLQGDYDEVPIDQLEKNAARVARKLPEFKEEIIEWIEAWKETKRSYSTKLARCNALA